MYYILHYTPYIIYRNREKNRESLWYSLISRLRLPRSLVDGDAGFGGKVFFHLQSKKSQERTVLSLFKVRYSYYSARGIWYMSCLRAHKSDNTSLRKSNVIPIETSVNFIWDTIQKIWSSPRLRLHREYNSIWSFQRAISPHKSGP
jgi:hypothetical protein